MEPGSPMWSMPSTSQQEPGTTPRFLAWASSSEKEEVRAFHQHKKFKMRLIRVKMNLETKDGVMDSGSSPLSN